MSGQPYVNGVSPCEGPPGTRVKISGEYLGVGAADVVSVKICGHECLETVEWLSSHRLVCQTREGFGKGSIIVSTLSGGVGTCTVVFNGTSPPPENVVRKYVTLFIYSTKRNIYLFKKIYVLTVPRLFVGLNPIVESDVWADEVWDVFETSSGSMSQSDKRKTVADPMGLMDGRATRTLSQQNIRQLCPEGKQALLCTYTIYVIKYCSLAQAKSRFACIKIARAYHVCELCLKRVAMSLPRYMYMYSTCIYMYYVELVFHYFLKYPNLCCIRS